MITKFTPDTVRLPVPNYVAATRVTNSSDILYVSGQVGVNIDGYIPDGIYEQTRVALQNLFNILKSVDMGINNIAKLNFFLRAGEDVYDVRRARNEMLNLIPVASTIVFITALVQEDLLVEIDCTAAR